MTCMSWFIVIKYDLRVVPFNYYFIYLNIINVQVQELKRRQSQMMTPMERLEKLARGSKNCNKVVYLILAF